MPPERTTEPGAELDELELFDALPDRFRALKSRLGEVVVGQNEIIEQLLVATFCQGHTLIIGVPGLAKTLLVRALAASLDLRFTRVQFTPDLMPSDILGSEVLQTDPLTGERVLRFVEGPIFTNILLADELNRTPPKTQAALLEAMEERQVSVAGAARDLQPPFIVMATQNPIEQEGAYPLPEAQLDRFLFTLNMDYPSLEEERRIAAEGDRIAQRVRDASPLFDGQALNEIRAMIGRVPVSDHVVDLAVRIVRATRPADPLCPSSIRPLIEWGAGPRAGQALLLAARCLAALTGEPTPGTRHIARLALPALRGRIIPSFAAAADDVSPDEIIRRVLKSAGCDM